MSQVFLDYLHLLVDIQAAWADGDEKRVEALCDSAPAVRAEKELTLDEMQASKRFSAFLGEMLDEKQPFKA